MSKLLCIFCVNVFCIFGPNVSFINAAQNLTEAGSEQWQSHPVNKGWSLKKIPPCERLTVLQLDTANSRKGKGWYTISEMPMMVHDILLEHKIIEIPWLPGQAEKCKWVAENDWLYAVNFPAHPKKISFLRFDGLDVIADIYLNGKLLATQSNMHLPIRIDATNKLEQKNSLAIHFHTPFKHVGEKLEIIKEFKGMEVRHSTHNYDNYLGAVPYFCRIGVFDGIFLETTSGSEISETVIDASLNKELTIGTITVDLTGTVKNNNGIIRTVVFDPLQRIVNQQDIQIKTIRESLKLQHKLTISAPELWWPRGYGDQPLYKVEISLLIDNRIHQVIERKIGFRSITMPEHLHFMVNGKRVWLWGANFVTPHWHTAVYDRPRVEQLYLMAAHANMIALRTWADVEAPRDHFYELADSLGFLIWHDFPQLFQNWKLPNTEPGEKMRYRCLTEASYWVKKLKHHPSIFLWCGGNEEPLWNNEVFNGFVNRGPWALETLAREVGRVCHKLDSSRIYIPSTPWNENEFNDPATETHGYSHLWYVPGYNYVNFASEDTRIAAPVLSSLKKFIAPEDLWPANYSPLFTPDNKTPFPPTWKKYAGEGSSYRKVGPVEQFYDATDAESTVQRIGMAEGLYYQQTIERQRRGRPADDTSTYRRCGGYLVWKLNDSWPQIYSAKIDYFMEPLHAYYSIRRAFAPLILSFEVGNYIWLWAVNDSPRPIEGTINIQLFHLDQNKVRKEITKKLTIRPGESKVVVRLDEAGIGLFRREHILSATLSEQDGKIIARTVSLADIERHITFPDAKLKVRVTGNALEITTDKFAHTVCIEGNDKGDDSCWFFDDNYFDIMPGEIKIVRILGKHNSGAITLKPWYSSETSKVEWVRSEILEPK